MTPVFHTPGSLGRAPVPRATRIHIFGNETAVKATVHMLDGFSPHAGQTRRFDRARHFREPRPQTYLVHGALAKTQALQNRLGSILGWKVHIPLAGRENRTSNVITSIPASREHPVERQDDLNQNQDHDIPFHTQTPLALQQAQQRLRGT